MTPEQITTLEQAEYYRSHQQYNEAVQIAGRLVGYDRLGYNPYPRNLAEAQIEGFGYRIIANSLLDLAKRAVNPREAITHLLGAKDILRHVYSPGDPLALELQSQVVKDWMGRPYHLQAEMYRDMAEYHELAHVISRNPQHYKEIGNSLKKAAETAPNGSSDQALAMLYLRMHERSDYRSIKEAYLDVMDTTPESGGWDRQAIVSWKFLRFAVINRDQDAARLAWGKLTEATRNDNVSLAKEYIFKRGVMKPLFTIPVNIVRQLVFKYYGYSSNIFVLP